MGLVPPEGVVLAILQFLIFITTLMGNSMVIIVMWKYLSKRAVSNLFIVNMAVADLFTGFAALLQLIYTLVPSLNDNVYTCLFRYQMVILMISTSQLTITFTTMDRFIAVYFPTKYLNIMKPCVAYIIITITWIYSGVIIALPYVKVNSWDNNSDCTFPLVVQPCLQLWMAITLWVCTLITVTTYCLILRRAYFMYQKVKPRTISMINLSPQSGDYDSVFESSPSFYKPKYKLEKMTSILKGAKSLAVITLLFSVCWLPFTYFQLRAYITPAYVYSTEWDKAKWVVCLGMANSIVNPFIYAWQRKDFNAECKRFLSCRPPLTQTKKKVSWNLRSWL